MLHYSAQMRLFDFILLNRHCNGAEKGCKRMKVYVITKGQYSDYHICAVVTDCKKAQILREKFSDKIDDAKIEEFDTENHNDIFAGKNLYCIYFGKNGNVTNVFVNELDYFNPKDNLVKIFRDCIVQVNVFAFDEASAIKIAAEKRAIELAKSGYVC